MRFPTDYNPHSYFTSNWTINARTERPHAGTRGVQFVLVDADTGVPVPLPTVADYAGASVPVARVWAHHAVLSTPTGDVWVNPARYGWRIVVAPA